MIKDRANTPQEKREAIKAILEVWLKLPNLRLGQLIGNVIKQAPHPSSLDWATYEMLLEDGVETPVPKGYFNSKSRAFSDMYNIEDDVLVKKIKEFTAKKPSPPPPISTPKYCECDPPGPFYPAQFSGVPECVKCDCLEK